MGTPAAGSVVLVPFPFSDLPTHAASAPASARAELEVVSRRSRLQLMKPTSPRCLQTLLLLCALFVAACATTHDSTKTDWQRVAKQIQVGMRPNEVLTIILANRPPKSSPQTAGFASGFGAGMGLHGYTSYRLSDELVLNVDYEYTRRPKLARGAQAFDDEYARVAEPAKIARAPISTLR